MNWLVCVLNGHCYIQFGILNSTNLHLMKLKLSLKCLCRVKGGIGVVVDVMYGGNVIAESLSIHLVRTVSGFSTTILSRGRTNNPCRQNNVKLNGLGLDCNKICGALL